MPDPTRASSSSEVPQRLRVLVLGGAARDHALCHAFSQSPLLADLHAAPGNAGIAGIGTCHPDVAWDDTDALVALARRIDADLVVAGAEDLLVAGIASRMQEEGIACLGPSRAAARLEGSKTFAKELMERANLPTPAWRSCGSVAEAHDAVRELGGAVAVKADGLAAGCGAYVCRTEEAAFDAVHELMVERRFGASGDRVVVEQLVAGEEASVMALVDGTRVVPLPAARDYKRLRDDDEGPNTGGMGAHAPSSALDPELAASLARTLVQPAVDELREQGTPFRGVIYAGVMLTADGPQLLEYNCRFGNPETQALVRVLDADLLELVHLAAVGTLDGVHDVTATGAAVAVCVAAGHYPQLQIEPSPVFVRGLEAARAVPGVELYVGMTQAVPGEPSTLLALGGRVVTVSAWAEQLEDAADRAHAAAELIQLEGRQRRTDIGRREVAGRYR